MNKRRLIIFLGVGVINTLIDFLFYSLLAFFFFPGKESIWLVGFISGTFALICAFTTHRLITWRNHPASRLTLIKFIVVTGFGLWAIRPILLSWFITFDGVFASIHSLTNYVLPLSFDFIQSTTSFLMMVIIVTIYNYLTYDRFVFNKLPKDIDLGSDSGS